MKYYNIKIYVIKYAIFYFATNNLFLNGFILLKLFMLTLYIGKFNF